MAELEPAWLRTESPPGQWLSDTIAVYRLTTSVSVILRLNPGVHSSCLRCVSVAGTFLCVVTVAASITAGVLGVPLLEATLDSDVSPPGSSYSFLPGWALRIVSLLVQSHTAVNPRDPQHSSYSSSSSKTGDAFRSQGTKGRAWRSLPISFL